jgi:hypothetical protein
LGKIPLSHINFVRKMFTASRLASLGGTKYTFLVSGDFRAFTPFYSRLIVYTCWDSVEFELATHVWFA